MLVLLHGLLMDGSLWDEVVAGLSGDFRCVVPTLPLGAHRLGMRDGADLSLPGIARLTAEFLDRLDLRDVTLAGNDTGGALVQLLMADGGDRVGRAVLVSCDAFDNFPPGLTGKTLVLTGRLPAPLFGLFMQQMRVRLVRRLPIAFGWLTRRGDAATARWMRPVLTQPEIRRDTVRLLRAAAADRRLPGPGVVAAAGLYPAGAGRLGQRRPGHAARARPAAGRAAAAGPAGRGGGQLHADPARPARSAGSAHPRLRPLRGRQLASHPPRPGPDGVSAVHSSSAVTLWSPATTNSPRSLVCRFGAGRRGA